MLLTANKVSRDNTGTIKSTPKIPAINKIGMQTTHARIL